MPSFDAIGVGSEDRQLLSSISSWSLGLAGVLGLLGVLALVSPWAAAGVVDAVCGFSLIAAGLSQLAMSAGTFTWRIFILEAATILALVSISSSDFAFCMSESRKPFSVTNGKF